ncbi:hypothetical protein ZEAMMB73_Zm00001d005742 [Zea mays]|uniref:Uncharacterized protein n=1 Tax=Zea mays TaxID=4577 RepID=A0A1D6EPT9_MAIZE|nr:hypothetical protein ZEAMMB73_Zm00001d005742 [Zea mays]
MGAENGSNNPSSTVLDGLYGVQLGRPSDPAQTDGGASSSPAACEHHHKRGRGGTAQAQQRLQIRRLWQHRPSCFKPIHCTITCTCLSRAVGNENPRLLMAASALLLPFQPLVVSAVHTGLMEASNVSFARRASMEPELRMAHNLHKVSSLLGGALFIADDCFPETPYIHAAWHLAAAIGVGTCNKLLE